MSLSKIVAQGVRNPFSAPDKQHMLYSAQNWYWCNISSTSFFFFFALLKTTVVTFSKKQSLIGYIEVYEQNALIITKRKNLCLHRESTSKKTLFSLIDWNRCQGQSTTSSRYRSVTIASLWKQGFTQDSFVDYWRTWAREKDSKYFKKKSTPNIPGGDENSYIKFNLKEKVYLFELRF